MDQPTKTHTGITWRQRQSLLENYALLTENASELGATFAEWTGFYRPASPGESVHLELAVMALVQRDRVLGYLTEVVNQRIRTAIYDYDCEQEDLVQHYRGMLQTDPGAALVGLKRFALGVRYLILRWERLLRLLRRDDSWFGADVVEAINCLGARASKLEDLHESEGAFLTWIYCLMTQPSARPEAFRALASDGVMPRAIRDQKPEHWLPLRDQCRVLLEEVAERELAALRPREEHLRLAIEEPARDSAEIRKQVLAGPEGAQILRQQRMHEQHFHRAYEAFLKGRKQSDQSGRVPGGPVQEIHGEAGDRCVGEGGEESITRSVMPTIIENGREERKRRAETLAPGRENGIGAPFGAGDRFQTAVRARGLTAEKIHADAVAEAEEAGEEPPPRPPSPGPWVGPDELLETLK